MWKKIFLAFFVLFLFASVAAGGFLVWGYLYITRDLPQLDTIDDYHPKAASIVYAADGTPIAEFYEQRRYPIKLKEIPDVVRKCFLAAEDASFYQHPGIDPVGILRAMLKNLRSGKVKQGGSTITQQVVKNLLLTSEKRLVRKVKEAILAYRLEQRLSKDGILEIYLNQIFFGNNAYGIRAASLAYFHKEPADLSLAEGAMLASLPKAPSIYSPLLHPELAKKRQRYVLGQMVKAGFTTAQAASDAAREDLKYYRATGNNIFKAPYYVAEVRRLLTQEWKDLNIDTDGLQIYTALDLDADRMAQTALQRGLREVDKRRGWRGPLKSYPRDAHAQFLKDYPIAEGDLVAGIIYPALVKDVSPQRGTARVEVAGKEAVVDLKSPAWPKKRLARDEEITWIKVEDTVRPGDVIEVMAAAPAENSETAEQNGEVKVVLDQTPEIEGAVVVLDPNSGKVITTIGGYSYQRSVFNRATQGLRQPGSAFKPVVYLAAVDKFSYTPTTIVYDTPRTFRVGDQFWTPGNFDEKFLGAITLRTALEKSRNLVSADIISRIGVDAAITYARKLGITAPLGRNLSLALGSSEVSLLELTRAFGVFPARGVLFDSSFVTRIVDRDGREIYDYESQKLPQAKQVIPETSAFIMANLMRGVVERGTGYKAKALGRPAAGKTGTSNEQMDAWFLGYTPQLVCGVWVGFDQKKTIGEKETGGVVSAPVWLYFMKDYMDIQDKRANEKLVQDSKAEAERLGIDYVPPDPLEPLDFQVPDGVEGFWINRDSGTAASPNAPGAFLEYFVKGTEPNRTSAGQESTNQYLESPEL